MRGKPEDCEIEKLEEKERKLTPCGDVADMDCAQCGALANSEWTWVEWYSDTLCGRCWRENKEGGAR
jgi:hypothetical protein